MQSLDFSCACARGVRCGATHLETRRGAHGLPRLAAGEAGVVLPEDPHVFENLHFLLCATPSCAAAMLETRARRGVGT